MPPVPAFDLRFEALVEDRARPTRESIAFAGLPWDDACLACERSPRAVQTASNLQIREPVQRSAIFDGDASMIMFSRRPQGIDQWAEVVFINTPSIDRIRKEFLPNLHVACRVNRALGTVKFKTLGIPFET